MKQSVSVFGKKIKIKVTDLTAHNAYGLFIPLENIIYIHKDLNKEQQFRTLMHELVHAIVSVTGLNQAQLSMDLEEIIAECFSNFMCDTFDIKFKK